MNQSEKLDKILEAFGASKIQLKQSAEDIIGFSVSDYCKLLKLETEAGEDRILEAILLHDGYLECINPKLKFVLRISNKGVNFISNGGYQQLDIDKETKLKEEMLNLKLIQSNITTNNWTKVGILLSILISVIALVISIVSIISK